jgi:pyridoxal phosphate enzyme (YggS family)
MSTTISHNIQLILKELSPYSTQLIAVTKTRSIAELLQTYEAGIKEFGENRVQEMIEKQPELPSDIQWHQIGHLQTNKVKYIAPFVHLIHSVDSLKLLKEINKEAQKNNRVIPCLLQIYIAKEESKFGLDKNELLDMLTSNELSLLKNVQIIGLMGMASFTENMEQVKKEFQTLKLLFDDLQSNQIGYENGNVIWREISMGMSGDYLLAAAEGSTMVRVGSAIYGPRK